MPEKTSDSRTTLNPMKDRGSIEDAESIQSLLTSALQLFYIYITQSVLEIQVQLQSLKFKEKS